LKKNQKHTIDLLIDHVRLDSHASGNSQHSNLSSESPEPVGYQVTEKQIVLQRVQEAIEKAFELGGSSVKIFCNQTSTYYSSKRMCVTCGISCAELEPRLFSFNSPIGACSSCHGLGIIHSWPWAEGDPDAWKAQYPDFFGKYATIHGCSACQGKRLNPTALAVTVANKTIDDIVQMPIKTARQFFKTIALADHERAIVAQLLPEIVNRLTFLENVGLTYVTLARSMRTLSGGEAQRIRLATQIGSALSGVLYVMDEPSIGLHQRDNARLIKTLKSLRDQGNTVVVVEHDIDTVKAADHVIDMGPAAGIHGGKVTACGTVRALAKNKQSLTGAYLAGTRFIAVPEQPRKPRCFMTLYQLTRNNLVLDQVKFPLGVFCGVSGVSGSGKSTLVLDELVPALEREFKLPYTSSTRNWYQTSSQSYIEGAQSLANLVVIDQSPIGRTPRSNPATYLGIFDEIRQLFAQLPESNARGYGPGRFSFNVDQGRCFECRGEGEITVSMHLLPDVVVPCNACKGKRYGKQTLEIRYKGKNIYDILQMTALEARTFFSAHSALAKRLQILCDVGLDYVPLGQPATTLSGGEAQRIKLVRELSKRGAATLYVLDEPTTGLHSDDIVKLLRVLNSLVDKGNTVIVIEHNLDVLKSVDYVIDLGPEGGDEGGRLVACGTPVALVKAGQGHTAHYLKPFFEKTVT
jgi:excinuclease ABC subunit A